MVGQSDLQISIRIQSFFYLFHAKSETACSSSFGAVVDYYFDLNLSLYLSVCVHIVIKLYKIIVILYMKTIFISFLFNILSHRWIQDNTWRAQCWLKEADIDLIVWRKARLG